MSSLDISCFLQPFFRENGQKQTLILRLFSSQEGLSWNLELVTVERKGGKAADLFLQVLIVLSGTLKALPAVRLPTTMATMVIRRISSGV